jgi:hypothetical protein
MVVFFYSIKTKMTVETYPTTHLAESEKASSRLLPELQAFVRSAEFKVWFGDWENDPENASKIVEENGEPALVYFGGPSGITRLHGDKRTRTGPDELGFYFTHRQSNARFYASTLRDRQTGDVVPSSIYPAFLAIRNPYERHPGDSLTSVQHKRLLFAVLDT